MMKPYKNIFITIKQNLIDKHFLIISPLNKQFLNFKINKI